MEIPWDVHRHAEETGSPRRFRRVIVGLVRLAMFVIGIGFTSGIV